MLTKQSANTAAIIEMWQIVKKPQNTSEAVAQILQNSTCSFFCLSVVCKKTTTTTTPPNNSNIKNIKLTT